MRLKARLITLLVIFLVFVGILCGFRTTLKIRYRKGTYCLDKEVEARFLLTALALQQSVYYPHVLWCSAMNGVGFSLLRHSTSEAKPPLAMSGPSSYVPIFMPTATRLHHLPFTRFRRLKKGYMEPRWTTSSLMRAR